MLAKTLEKYEMAVTSKLSIIGEKGREGGRRKREIKKAIGSQVNEGSR